MKFRTPLPGAIVFFILAAIGILAAPPARADGILGDIINRVLPGAGTTLDDAHRRIKDAIPPYKALEEGASHTVNEAFVQAGAPALQELIARSRDDALRAGTEVIPPAIRRNLAGFMADAVLNAARYRVSGGGDLTLQVNAIRYGEAQAITLDYVIVFKESNDALYNPSLWAHELTHVSQYQSWGLRDFSIRYLRDYQAVERPAYEAETRYMAWAGLQNTQQWASTGNPLNASMVNRPVASFSVNAFSSTCSTSLGACLVNGTAPVGTPCWCNTPGGTATGALVPNAPTLAPPQGLGPPSFPPPVATGFPRGYGMQVCGCWGPNPFPTAPESRCASGRVRVSVCQGFCAPGHPLYAYVCD